MSKKQTDALTKYLDDVFEHKPDMSKENRTALYGYLFAHYEMELITLDEFEALWKRLDLTTEEMDDLLL